MVSVHAGNFYMIRMRGERGQEETGKCGGEEGEGEREGEKGGKGEKGGRSG